jgi:signal transduction histidine kinase/CheY-like chemotaxis protein
MSGAGPRDLGKGAGVTQHERRVLVLAPTERDATNTTRILGRAGIAAEDCCDIDALCSQARAGVGAIILTVETLATPRARRLADFLADQPKWSDLPFIALTREGPDSAAALQAMQMLGNVIVLERPVRVATLVTAARTALRERERQYEVRRLLAELRDSDRRKDIFLAMLAHELRNPLAPIRNATAILHNVAPARSVAARATEIMERQVTQLARLVDDLLDVSRITQGKIQLKRERVTLQSLVEQAVETIAPLIDSKGQTLAVHMPSVPLWLEADPARIAQVIGNLLSNAAKYTHQGGKIRIGARCTNGALVLRVRDNGMGIPAPLLPRIFDLFVQVESSLDHSQGGLGIGLTLVKGIVELHRGGVRARSAGPGEGSSFLFWLPAVPGYAGRAEPASPRTEAVNGHARKLLLVDDNVDAVQSLALLLGQLGHDVRTAHDGAAGLELARQFHPEVVILDIGLPGIDGYEVARRIRSDSGLADVKLVALTGYGQREDRGRALAAGFDHHLIKPADLSTLQGVLR